MTAPVPAPAAGPSLHWRDGAPFSPRYGEGYYGAADALAESRHVFLAGNDLPARFATGFSIAELGFGTGLNALAAAEAWKRSGQPGVLTFTAVENAPLRAEDMARALAPWPELGHLAKDLLSAWAAGRRRIALSGLVLEVIEGDARDTLPSWSGRADAWFLDGFSPARNPELWEAGLLAALAQRTAPDGTFATFTAAGATRRALAAAGFSVERAPGHAGKRHMTRGRRAVP
jgi:tRNA U34 5-methylaminomethyl-2-thiouridine-forming methyltransferase MnmC